jgi:16S rRNA (adenine(1408)-N(1))-methyltransferase
VSVVRVLGKGRTADVGAVELAALRDVAARTVVDVGTGDGRFAYALASEHDDWLVIGTDALDEPMEETAHKALRKPSRGGRANLVFLRSSIEGVPTELAQIADEVFVVLPWGRLLEGIVMGDAAVIGGLATLARPGARVEVTLNGEIWLESMPVRYEHLPVPTTEYVHDVIAPAFATAGLVMEGAACVLTEREVAELPSTWARKLSHGRVHPTFVRFVATSRA